MSHEVRQMAYRGEVPWHGLGADLSAGADIETWKREAGLDFTVKTAPVQFQPNAGSEAGQLLAFPGKVVTYRADDGTPLGVVSSSKYNVVQPSEVLDFYREFVTAGQMELETAGALRGGRRIWALARLDHEIRLPGNDISRPYFNLTTSFDGETATLGTFTAIRVVCANTLGMYYTEQKVDAETGDTIEGQPITGFSVAHNSKFNPEKARARVGQLLRAAAQYEQDMQLLCTIGVNPEQALAYFLKLFGRTKKDSKDLTPQSRANVGRLVELYQHGPGAQLESARGTAFGLLNAVTRFTDHEARQRSPGGRLASAWYGAGRETKNAALREALLLKQAA